MAEGDVRPSPQPRAHPTLDDPVVAGLSEGVGGPLGPRAAPHPWWTPARVVVALAAVCFALGMLQKWPCQTGAPGLGERQYSAMCYSDMRYQYTGRGLVELAWPYTDDPQVRERHEATEYPVGTAYWQWGTAWATHWLAGSPDLDERYDVAPGDLAGLPAVAREVSLFAAVNAVGLALAAMLAAWFLAGVNPGRPWDAAAFAVSPALALSALVNWDLLAVALVAGALWAWARERPVLTGVLIGLGTAVKLYPLFLLGGVLVICLFDQRLRDLARVVAASALAWLLANAPAYLTSETVWARFWGFNAERGADLGSLWLALAQSRDLAIGPEVVNPWSLGLFVAWCLAVLVVGLRAPATPRLAQLGFLVVVGFLLVNKVYSPQYVLWLLPLAVLARPRWRDQVVWQACEVFYFAAVWWYLGGYLAPAVGDDAPVYWLAIVVRVAGQLWLTAVVVRDLLHPDSDPVTTARSARAHAPVG